MRHRLLQRLALLATFFVVGPGKVAAQETDALGFEARTYNGTNNNLDNPLWGSVNITQIRALAAANYSAISDDNRPSAREVTTQVFLAASSVRSPRSALFVGWALLMSYDLFLNVDDETLSLDIPCDDGHGTVDIWCPEGSSSEDISFNRSQAEVSAVRNPLNLATSYLDLDFMYGRSEEEAKALRTMEGGYMNLTEDGMPIENDDGTWLIGDQRTAVFPVTFALHIILLREHNICCDTIAPDLGYEGDEDIYQACRGWTIAVYEHITDNDFNVRFMGVNILSSDEYTPFDDIVSSSYATASSSSDSTDTSTYSYTDDTTDSTLNRRGLRRLHDLYTGEHNPGADVLATTVGVAALYAAIPPTVRIMDEGYDPADEDGIELTEAAEDIAGLFKRNSLESIIRGAAFSSTLAVDTHFSSAVSTTSPLFKLPVDAIQRGRDHGVPNYNDAREAYGLSRATSFADVTQDTNVQALLEDAYGDISLLDALTGALAEGSNMSSSVILGELLQEVWKEQLYRAIVGDRLFHSHDVPTTDAENQTLHGLIERTTNVTDLHLSVFTIPEITVCYDSCSTDDTSSVYLSDGFILAWSIQDDYEYMTYTLSAKYIGSLGYMGIGFGGSEMATADDFITCEVSSSTSAECTDRQSVSSRTTPGEDTENASLNVTEVVIDGDWTSVTFRRYKSDLDDEDYDIYEDLDGYSETSVIFAYREGEGLGKHANSNRGSATVNFVTGSSTTDCDDDAEFYLLHGALILFAWLALMPVGIFFARYRKGKKEVFGSQWWETHSELMIVSSEMVLPLAITGIFTTSGDHNSEHAKWGFYMIAAIGLQIMTGFLRQKALEGKHPNFSFLHRVNKNVHIWAGHFAFLAGAFQCYRGVELVSATDSLHFSAVEDLVEFQVGNFGVVYDYVMPIWFGVIGALLLFFETRKQLARYRRKGAAMVCCFYEMKNKGFVATGRKVDDENDEENEAEHRLMPRTQALPLYTMDEFNLKVLNGMSWVIVDGAVLDVGSFSRRHPGGARVILNALGTDITNELKGEDLSVGGAMAFTPNEHSETAWELARSLVVGYIEEEDDDDDDDSDGESDSDDNDATGRKRQTTEQMRLASVFGSVPGMIGSARGEGSLYTSTSAKPSKEATMRAAMIARTWAEKANRKGSVNAVPLAPAQTSLEPAAAASFFEAIQKKRDRRKFVLQRFHVCPFVMRQRMDRCKSDDRAVYRYVFACPGEAEVLAQAATGVCYFNMRIVRKNGDSVVQRSYNATAVRVIKCDASGAASSTRPAPTPPASAAGHSSVTAGQPNVAAAEEGKANAESSAARPIDAYADAPGVTDGSAGASAGSKNGRVTGHGRLTSASDNMIRNSPAAITKEGMVKVVPAVESREGLLCLEMRIRLYKDGAMSKLLEQLPNDSMNAAVQLQGPFLVDKLSPPPAYRNVIMIAAGTGINPMVQLIRDYQSFDSQDTLRTTGRSRLALLWQATTVSDLYCAGELRSLEARGRGLLEITTLVSDSHRKTNDPKAPTALQRRRKRRAEAAAAKKAGVGAFAGNSHSRRKSSSLIGLLFSGSPSSSRNQSVDVSAVVDRSLAPVSETKTPEDGKDVITAARDALSDIAVGSRSAEADGTDEANNGSFLSGHHASVSSLSAAASLFPAGGEHLVDSIDEEEIYHPESEISGEVLSQIFLASKESKVDPDDSEKAESVISTVSTFVPAPGMATKPRAISRPSRDLVQGAHGAPRGAVIASSSGRGRLSSSLSSCWSTASFGQRKGKICKDVLREVFGEGLMKAIDDFNTSYPATLGTSHQGVERSGLEAELAALCGTETQSGKLQVVLSGPSGFVFHVEHMLEEIGVPKQALVILD